MRKTVIVDLDGTLFNTNTFVHYIIFVGKCALKKLDILTVCSLFLFVTLRKVRIISTHELMKYYVLKCSLKYAQPEKMQKLVDKLIKFENTTVVELMNNYRLKGYSMMLSTAAPVAYAQIVASRYGFDCFCASEMPSLKDWKENVNEQKKENTMNVLKKTNGELSVLLTDHYDDIPLLSIPKEENYLVNPKPKTEQKLKEKNITYRLL